MTREELLNTAMYLKFILQGFEVASTEAAEKQVITDFFDGIVEYLSAPQPLKRWTEKDGIPPDGHYIGHKHPIDDHPYPLVDGYVIRIEQDRIQFWGSDSEGMSMIYDRTENLWFRFHVLDYAYPLEEPVSGEPGGAE